MDAHAAVFTTIPAHADGATRARVFSRRARRRAGLTIIVLGLLLGLGAAIGHLAWALPLNELPQRPGIFVATVWVLSGACLTLGGRRSA
jgi:hypothetical protein